MTEANTQDSEQETGKAVGDNVATIYPDERGENTAGGEERPVLASELFDEKNKKFFQKKAVELGKIKTKRAEMNDEKAAIISAMVDKGLDRHGVKRFLQYRDMDEKKRHNSDLTFQYLCRIHGIGLQDDLFEACTQEHADRHQASKH